MWSNFKSTRQHQGGAALLTVLVALLIITIMLFEFQYQTMVERQMASNDLEQLQAYYLAKSGIQLGALRVALYGRALKAGNLRNIPGMQSHLERIWSLPFPNFPPDTEDLSKLSTADKSAAEKTLSQTKIEAGSFAYTISTESAKINLNYLIIPEDLSGQFISFRDSNQKTLFEYVGKMLLNLIDNFIRESDDPYKEFGNINPEELVYDIMDWINKGGERIMGGPKDGFYQQLDPPYKAKRNVFFTIEELRMVRGMNDAIFRKLKPHVTVFSDAGKININHAGGEVIMALHPSLNEEDVKRILQERANRTSASSNGWATEKEFVDFITQELNRSEFGQTYDEPNNYPFTVNTQSFVVESMGLIPKSASQITKRIRVAMALTHTGKVQKLPQFTNKGDCEKDQANFWDERVPPGECKSKPTNKKACEEVAGSWTEEKTQLCCAFNNIGKKCLPKSAQAAKAQANALKILEWSEI